MKKFTFHMDAIIVAVIVFLLSLGFIAFQRYQFAVLQKEYVALKLEAINTKLDLISAKKSLKTCEGKMTEQNIQSDSP